MVKKVLLLGLLCLVLNGLQAQKIIDTWSFHTGVDSTMWMDISGHDSVIIAGSNSTAGRTTPLDIGFPFTFGETTHTKFSTNINGTIRLGNSLLPASGNIDNPLSTNLNTAPKIEPFGMQGRFYNNSYTRIARMGTEGNRVLVVETRLSGRYWEEQGNVRFQVQLFETGGIRIVYGMTNNYSAGCTTAGYGAQAGFAASGTSTNKDVIFIDFVNNEAVRFDESCNLRNPDGMWVEAWRWYELKPDSNYCPYPPSLTALNPTTDNLTLANSYGGLADLHLTIPELGIDTIWPRTESFFNLVGNFNPRTTYSGTVVSLCDSGRTSYRSREFHFTTTCGDVKYLPWLDNFTGANSALCWDNSRATNSTQGWKVSSSAMQCGTTTVQTYNEWLVSPIINLPDEEGIVLRWKHKATVLNNVAPMMNVCVGICNTDGEVDSNSWTTLMTVDTTYNYYTTLRAVLDGFEGMRVRVAFVRTGTGGKYTYIDDVELLLEQAPVISLTAPQTLFVGDTAVATCSITSGVTDGAQWHWHSSLTGEWYTDSAQLTLVYDSSCFDTLTVIVSNTYGADTAVAVIRVVHCNTQIPWVETFETEGSTTYSDCWDVNEWDRAATARFINEDGEQQTYRNLMLCLYPSNSNHLLSPTIAIPSTDVDNLKLWVECAAGELLVTISSVADSADSINNYTDTLIFVNQSGNDTMRWFLTDLSPYAGDTVSIGFFHSRRGSVTYINSVKIDYDTLPILSNIAGADTLGTDVLAPYSTQLLHGPAEGLYYTWTSTLGDIVTQNSEGDTVYVYYTHGGIDTLTAIATNAYGSDTMTKIIQVMDCAAITELPWTETFENGIWCWHILDGSNWSKRTSDILFSNGEYRRASYIWSPDDTAHRDSWIISPEIHIPADVDECTRFFWKVSRSSSNTPRQYYDVMICLDNDYLDTTTFFPLYEDSAMHPYLSATPYYDYLSADLSSYAGETVHIAFRHLSRNRLPSSDGLYIYEAEVRSAKVPVLGGIEVPENIFTEDSVQHAVAILNEGNPYGMTYEWYSSLNGDTIVTTGDTLPLTYSMSGIDTLRLVVSNSYGSDTTYAIVHVHHCSAVSLPLVENFKDENTMTCWRIWNFRPDNTRGGWRIGELLTPDYNVIGAGINYIEADAWLVTPEMDIVSDGVNLRVKVYGGSSAASNAYLTILASTTGIDTADFSDTLYHAAHYTHWEDIVLPMNSYAGQHVRLAFVHTGYSYYSCGICLDSLSISYDYLPHATVTYNTPNLDNPTIYRASINNCVSTGLQYTWHSTLTNTTLTGNTDSLVLMYTAGGIDTVTFIARNAYGADTVTMVVNVLDCTIRALPYREVFEGGTYPLTCIDTTGIHLYDIPFCWESPWSYMHNDTLVLYVTPQAEGTNDSTNKVMMYGGTSHVTSNYVALPRLDTNLNVLALSLDYLPSPDGTLSVGYLVGETYTSVQELTLLATLDSTLNMYRDTVHFTGVNAPDDARIAIHYNNTESGWSHVLIDNVELFIDSSYVPPVPDTVWRTVTVDMLSIEGIDVSSHTDLNVSGAGRYADSSVVTLTASYGVGLVFWYWVTPANDTIRENPLEFTITSDTSFTAIFGPMCVGIDDVKGSHSVEVYPNPASSIVTVMVSGSSPTQVTVTDIHGREVLSVPLRHSATQPLTLDVSHLAAGTYFLRIATMEGIETKKLIIE